MSDLSDLTAHVESIAKSKSDESDNMMKLITSMSKKINMVRENVDNIRSGSLEIGNRIKEVIKGSEDTQKANLLKIKNSITQLGNVTGINNALQGLDKDINLLVQKAVGGPSNVDPSRPRPPEQGASGQSGGYTYGSSASSSTRSKGTRSRSKKTRRYRKYKN
jgi:seryl-tRNA synthetase